MLRVTKDLNCALEHTIIVPNFDVLFNQLKEKAYSLVLNNRTSSNNSTNFIKSNPDKCHLLVSSCKKIKMEVGDFDIENSTCEKLLGVHFDNSVTFDYHMSELCKKASKKTNALARVSQYMNFLQETS